MDVQRNPGAAVERESFSSFFLREYPRLVRAVATCTTSLAEAEDLVQDAMARAYEHWHRVSDSHAPAAYVYTIAINLHRRRQRRRATFPWERLLARGGDREQKDPVAKLVLHDELFAALAELPDGQRDAVLLVDWFDVDAATAAKVLGVEPGSVRSQVHRGRQALKNVLERS
jgi:RNA polymerase sigma factor (sigma-70 family)